jgi:hypothetical protein
VKNNLRLIVLFSGIVGFGLLGCQQDDEDNEAPQILALELDEAQLHANTAHNMGGVLRFRDVDGNVSRMEIEIVTPSQVVVQANDVDLETLAGGLIEGEIRFALLFLPLETGTHEMRFRLVDDHDIESEPNLLNVEVQ